MSVKEENENNVEEVVEMEVTAKETVEVDDRKAKIKALAIKGLKIGGVIGVAMVSYFIGKARGSNVDTSIPEVVESEIIDK